MQETAVGWTDLHDLIDVFVNSTDEEFPTKISAMFDVEVFLKASAVELTLLRRDGTRAGETRDVTTVAWSGLDQAMVSHRT